MSVYHSLRSMQQSSEDDEDIEEQDGMVLVNVATQAQPTSPIHPASDRNSGHVSLINRLELANAQFKSKLIVFMHFHYFTIRLPVWLVPVPIIMLTI